MSMRLRRRDAYVVFNAIATLSEGIIFEIQDLEARMELLYKRGYLKRTLVVTEGHGVDSESGELFNEADEGV